MAEGKHTPGPWYISKKGGSFCVDAPLEGEEPGDTDYRIAKTYASPFSPAPAQSAANARLIAAAPDLLAACQRVLAGHGPDRPSGPSSHADCGRRSQGDGRPFPESPRIAHSRIPATRADRLDVRQI
jgi:hypothetical protein